MGTRYPRILQPVFAGSASNNGVFGSAQAGTKVLSNSLPVLMGLAAWSEGWIDAVMGGASKFPPLEEFQAIDYVVTSQLAYLLQQGIPEYDATTSYYLKNIVVKPGTWQLYGSLTNDNLGNALTDPANWQLLVDLSGGQRLRLLANANFYVSPTGNDANLGTIGSPWATINHALNYIASNIDLGGFNAIINLVAGTITGGVSLASQFTGGGAVQILGSGIGTSLLSVTGSNCLATNNNAVLSIGGLKMQCPSGGSLITASGGSMINVISPIDFGLASSEQITAGDNAAVLITTNYTISAGAGDHWKTAQGGIIRCQGQTITLTGTPNFGGAFAVTDGGVMSIGANTFSGAATGIRYVSSDLGTINTSGGGANYLPGNSAGSTNNGGIYV